MQAVGEACAITQGVVSDKCWLLHTKERDRYIVSHQLYCPLCYRYCLTKCVRKNVAATLVPPVAVHGSTWQQGELTVSSLIRVASERRRDHEQGTLSTILLTAPSAVVSKARNLNASRLVEVSDRYSIVYS